MSAKDASSTRLVVTLALAGLMSGVVLVGVFLLTAPRIERNRAEALAAAILRVLPGSSRTSAFVLDGETLAPYDGPEGKLPEGTAIYAGFADDGALVGYAIPADGPGYMDTIKLIYGFDPGRDLIVGMEVLESRETPGLGDKIITDDEFLANFAALAVEPSIVPVKKGAKVQPNEVDCITGATISSESIVSILNLSSAEWRPRLDADDDTD